MATALANEIRPTTLPMYCSACFGQYPERRHIDFDAACDRGYAAVMTKGRSLGEQSNAVPVAMDDLILCEDCLKDGAYKLGMIDGEEAQRRQANLEARLEVTEGLVKREEAYVERLEAILKDRLGGLDHRRRPRRKVETN